MAFGIGEGKCEGNGDPFRMIVDSGFNGGIFVNRSIGEKIITSMEEKGFPILRKSGGLQVTEPTGKIPDVSCVIVPIKVGRFYG